MDYDYEKEAERIWALPEKEFMHECDTKPINTIPKYYLNLKEALMALIWQRFIGNVNDASYAWAINNNIDTLRKGRVYVTRLSTMQKPIRLQFFEGDLKCIEDTLDELTQKRDTNLEYVFNEHKKD